MPQGCVPNEARFRNAQLITLPNVKTSDLLYLIKSLNDLSNSNKLSLYQVKKYRYEQSKKVFNLQIRLFSLRIIFVLFDLNFFLNYTLVAHVGHSGIWPHSLLSLLWVQPQSWGQFFRDSAHFHLTSTSPPACTLCLVLVPTHEKPTGDLMPRGQASTNGGWDNQKLLPSFQQVEILISILHDAKRTRWYRASATHSGADSGMHSLLGFPISLLSSLPTLTT